MVSRSSELICSLTRRTAPDAVLHLSLRSPGAGGAALGRIDDGRLDVERARDEKSP